MPFSSCSSRLIAVETVGVPRLRDAAPDWQHQVATSTHLNGSSEATRLTADRVQIGVHMHGHSSTAIEFYGRRTERVKTQRFEQQVAEKRISSATGVRRDNLN
jgi:hypothetical protein